MTRETLHWLLFLLSVLANVAEDVIGYEVSPAMDLTADPCEDFYRYACGRWSENMRRSSGDIGGAHNTRRQRRHEIIRDLELILDEERSPTNMSASFRAAKDLYSSCVDKDAHTVRNLTGILSEHLFSYYPDWPLIYPRWNGSKFNVATVLAKLRLRGFGFLWRLSVVDINTTSVAFQIRKPESTLLKKIAYVTQGVFRRQLAPYFEMLTRVVRSQNPRLRSLQFNKDVHDIQQLEWELAYLVKTEDHLTNTHPIRLTVDDINNEVGKWVNWKTYLADIVRKLGIRFPRNSLIEVYDMSYLHDLSRLLNRTHKRALANYLFFRLLANAAVYLPKNVLEGISLHTTAEQTPSAANKRASCVEITNQCMRNTLSKEYVQRFFPESIQHEVKDISRRLKAALLEIIRKESWMDNATRTAAILKAQSMAILIGHQEDLVNPTTEESEYKKLVIRRDDYFGNMMRCRAFEAEQELNRIRKRPSSHVSDFSSTTVTAEISLNLNLVTLSAGLLFPPFYVRSNVRGLCYGSIGPIIAHEMFHGFGRDGKTYDLHGNEDHWWSPQSEGIDRQYRQCIAERYKAFRISGHAIKSDSQRTNEEDVADVRGLALAYEAYTSWAKDNNEERYTGSLNFTAEQLFFIANAQTWCGREISSFLGSGTEQHSADRYRVIGPMSNMVEFSQAFYCPLGSKMNPTTKCRIW